MRPALSALAAAILSLTVAACAPRTAAPATLAIGSPPQAPSVSPQDAAAAQAAPAAAAVVSADQALFKSAGFDVPSTRIMSADFTLSSLDGAKVSLSSYKGKLVVLSFWATWCVPCQQEMPAMQALYQGLRGKGFEILAVDVMEDKATVAKYRKDHGYTFPMLLDDSGTVAGLYGAQGIPTNYIIDGTGRVLARVVGVGGPSWTSPEMKALFDHLLSS
jgi:thiol-disulfide isomerase/thioredoxin